MIQTGDIQSLFFLGIGGIGMSALARYYHTRGYRIYGYDRTPSELTRKLEIEGMQVCYDENEGLSWLHREQLTAQHTLVVYTPAVPADSLLRQHLEQNGFDLRKRAEVLGLVTRQMRALCVAGTHGKTTTSTMLAHLMYQSNIGTNAFLGGISVNYQTNLLLQADSNYVVVEADEYDRSFHQLTPYMTIITSADPDHLDIYGTAEAYRESFEHYSSLVQSAVLLKQGVEITPRLQKGAKLFTYGVASEPKQKLEGNDLPNFYTDNIRVKNGEIRFDFHTPNSTLCDILLGVPVWVNIENATAAMAMAWLNGVNENELRVGMSTFTGVVRRFNQHVRTPKVAYLDDYAHHPMEIRSAIQSIKKVYPDRHSIGIFQPHLFTRTRDFANEFAAELSQLDEVVLLPIYPARELPIEGVTSEWLLSLIGTENKCLKQKSELCDYIAERVQQTDGPVVVLTIGAGDIDRLVPELTKRLIK